MSEHYKSLISDEIDKGVDTFRSDYLKDEKTRKYRVPVYKSSSNKMPLVDYAFERRLVLETKDKCIRPKGNKRSQKESTKRKWEPHKLSFGSEVEDAASTDQSQVQSYKKTLQILDGISTDTDLDDLEIVNMKEPSSMRKSGKSATRNAKNKSSCVIVLSSDENESSAHQNHKNQKKWKRKISKKHKNKSDTSTDDDC
ncbi:uncharacterized protein LOC125504370 isoform X3 [Dendroctonus ponderosae]|uniref:Protein TSSC4 n=1 Tax=Dendroctonus ponderosae TaxID=77166 RepID=A0AAR5Q106_DENPD|nr:uncharacterized protein LOC109542133 isoform X3 [Dendroctonus ponderosae]XP_048522193.1 uncharacterized protein LOC125504370 isoform X3 [Dendroctonus ponderosae]